jgi:hypothetical protein
VSDQQRVARDPDDLAAALRDAGAALAAAAAGLPPRVVPPGQLDRLRRQYIAVCTAAKVPGADQAACRRRLDDLMAALDCITGGKSGNKD